MHAGGGYLFGPKERPVSEHPPVSLEAQVFRGLSDKATHLLIRGKCVRIGEDGEKELVMGFLGMRQREWNLQ